MEFTYIGNVSPDYKFYNSSILKPLAGKELASEIRNHHIYVTASINEPSGNHHIEAAQCGLPILYIESGGIPEYCKGFGVSFTNDFEKKLELIISEYAIHKKYMEKYPFHSERMCEEYFQLFYDLVGNKEYNRRESLYSFSGRLFIIKNKFLKIFRDQIYLNIKNRLSYFYRKKVKRDG